MFYLQEKNWCVCGVQLGFPELGSHLFWKRKKTIEKNIQNFTSSTLIRNSCFLISSVSTSSTLIFLNKWERRIFLISSVSTSSTQDRVCFAGSHGFSSPAYLTRAQPRHVSLGDLIISPQMISSDDPHLLMIDVFTQLCFWAGTKAWMLLSIQTIFILVKH